MYFFCFGVLIPLLSLRSPQFTFFFVRASRVSWIPWTSCSPRDFGDLVTPVIPRAPRVPRRVSRDFRCPCDFRDLRVLHDLRDPRPNSHVPATPVSQMPSVIPVTSVTLVTSGLPVTPRDPVSPPIRVVPFHVVRAPPPIFPVFPVHPVIPCTLPCPPPSLSECLSTFLPAYLLSL